MSSSMKTGVFLLSLLAIFIYFTLTSGLSAFINNTFSQQTAYYIINFIVMFGFIAMLFTQAFVRILFVKKKLRNYTILDTIHVNTARLIDRIGVYAFPAIITLLPIYRNKKIYPSDIATLISLLILILLIEFLFYLFGKTMKIYITNNGFAIMGMDLRLDTPLPSSFMNPTGFYSIERLVDFVDMNDTMEISQSYDSGKIIIKSTTDQIKKIKGLLLANKVVQRKLR